MNCLTRRYRRVTWYIRLTAVLCGLSFGLPSVMHAATVSIDDSAAGQRQVIDGFGTCIGGRGGEDWFQKAYYDDMGFSIMRMDITPTFKAPYSDQAYNSPWFSNRPPLKIDDPANLGGPEHNNVRTYTGPDDYVREFGGHKAAIAVMGPDIDKNIEYFDFGKVAAQGAMARAGLARKDQLGDFKLYASMWSPAPWVKIANDQKWGQQTGVMPATGTPYPFIWAGNFAGGKLDVSDQPLAIFSDETGPTSALTQFARCTAAYIKGFQDKYGVRFYGISIQNELNFPEFYNSCVYAQSPAYLAALKAVRRELDQHADLKDILIIGPEDLLGNDSYSMWQLGGGPTGTHKNLQYLSEAAKDPEASAALAFFCVHGYANDGATAVGSDSKPWRWWAEGWQKSPAPGVIDQAAGFTSYHKKSWMTETSGEKPVWLEPSSGYPGNGAWSIALKIQQALTAGQESAYIYWQFAEGDKTTEEGLTQATDPTKQPKYIAMKHFAHFIRPGATRVNATASEDNGKLAVSAYQDSSKQTLTLVLVNKGADAVDASVIPPTDCSNFKTWNAVTSDATSQWQESTVQPDPQKLTVHVPGYGVVTVSGQR